MADTATFTDCSLREKLKTIRDSDSLAGHWARNIIQTLDVLKDNPNDPDLIRALGNATVMLERARNSDGASAINASLSPAEIAAIFGLGRSQ